MASKGMDMNLVMVLVTMICVGANAAQLQCNPIEIVAVSSCLNFVIGIYSTPLSFCCSEVANMVQSNPQCLCSLLKDGGPALGIKINQTLALELPGACNVQIPPVSTCNGLNRPTSSPVTSQVDLPASCPPGANGPTSSPSPVTSQVDSPASSPVDDYDENPYSPTTPSVNNVPAGSESKPVPSTGKNASTNAGSAPKPRKIKSSGNTIVHPLPLTIFSLIIMSGGLIINNF